MDDLPVHCGQVSEQIAVSGRAGAYRRQRRDETQHSRLIRRLTQSATLSRQPAPSRNVTGRQRRGRARSADMLGNLVPKMTVRRHAEPSDLCPATRMTRPADDARICMSARLRRLHAPAGQEQCCRRVRHASRSGCPSMSGTRSGSDGPWAGLSRRPACQPARPAGRLPAGCGAGRRPARSPRRGRRPPRSAASGTAGWLQPGPRARRSAAGRGCRA